MSKIHIYIQGDVTETNFHEIKQIANLLKSGKIGSNNYEIDIQPIDYSFNREDREKVSYSHMPMCHGTIHYRFDSSPTGSKVKDHQLLIEFAKTFETHVVDTLGESFQFKDWVSPKNLNDHFFLTAQSMMRVKETDKRQNWQAEEAVSNYHNSQKHTLFSSEDAKPKVEPGNSARTTPQKILYGGIALGVISVPIFFIEPITATILALVAILLIIASAFASRQINKMEQDLMNTAPSIGT